MLLVESVNHHEYLPSSVALCATNATFDTTACQWLMRRQVAYPECTSRCLAQLSMAALHAWMRMRIYMQEQSSMPRNATVERLWYTMLYTVQATESASQHHSSSLPEGAMGAWADANQAHVLYSPCYNVWTDHSPESRSPGFILFTIRLWPWWLWRSTLWPPVLRQLP